MAGYKNEKVILIYKTLLRIPTTISTISRMLVYKYDIKFGMLFLVDARLKGDLLEWL